MALRDLAASSALGLFGFPFYRGDNTIDRH